MSHHISLSSLILDYKRANSASNIDASMSICLLAPIVAAYVPPLPSGGPHDGEATYNRVASKFVMSIMSDINEHIVFDTQNCLTIAKEVYSLRYEAAHSGEIALTNPSVREVTQSIAGDVVSHEHIALWYNRFFTTFKHYYVEWTAKAE